MTLLAEDPDLWDTVFSESSERAGFIGRLARLAGGSVLDVGCATGSLCRLLRQRGIEAAGVDINARFIASARSKDPGGEYFIGDMKSLRLRRKFDLLVCLGTTFSYNLKNEEIRACLQAFRRHVTPQGIMVLDVLNAIAFAGPRPFRATTRHSFRNDGKRARATIRHRLNLKRQTMSEQVTWKIAGRRTHRDVPEELRLLFPQELVSHLESAGFGNIELRDGYGKPNAAFNGRRLIAISSLA